MIGRLFGLLGRLPMIFDVVGAAVVGVEAIGAATRATSQEKRRMAVDDALRTLADEGTTPGEALVGAIVDTWVRVLNVVAPMWDTDTAEAVASAKAQLGEDRDEAPAGSLRAEKPDTDLDAAADQARAELEAIEQRNRAAQ